VTTGQRLAFAGIVVLGAMSPGPDFAVVTRRAATGGLRAGTAAAAGVATGVLVWAAAVAAGLAAAMTALRLSACPAIIGVVRRAGRVARR
jgi:threonine/homoserine/homoserine lactone efflux protein